MPHSTEVLFHYVGNVGIEMRRPVREVQNAQLCETTWCGMELNSDLVVSGRW